MLLTRMFALSLTGALAALACQTRDDCSGDQILVLAPRGVTGARNQIVNAAIGASHV
ncbi:uncharacterized protein LY89DRAFT_729070 [Mollisia scopiformis]|uniref:Uncharacterized protein n=1 Tax=Mollisia scopiformis TaxID=149040 RepID=A0A194XN42_MOLSC|nr:uncharacterized protein LY89DRAFT_729070 [Mollisia scopiformis]KUJ21551.1 hypothetical protein LY89DRAFT_729070 [Mollisia scopiformis]